MGKWLFAAFLAVPLIEIGLFITVGGWLGLWPTLGIVIVTALIGTVMVRKQGAATLGDLKSRLDRLSDPSEPIAHGAMILFSGALLLTPGFMTDAIGFALLVPAVRQFLIRKVGAEMVRSRIKVREARMAAEAPPRQRQRPADRVVEAEWEEIPPKSPTHGNSGWTRH